MPAARVKAHEFQAMLRGWWELLIWAVAATT